MARPQPRELEVLNSALISPHMLRITLGGEQMADFPVEQESAYVKLLLPQPGDERPLMRTYTIRRQRADEIDIDFALHEHAGPASSWAQAAGVGDRISIAGPGGKKLINSDADWLLLAGDMTALPAIAVNLEQLPAAARGYAVIAVSEEGDRQPLAHPPGVEVHWLVTDPFKDGTMALLNHIRALPRLPGKGAVWAACEFDVMRQLRQYFRAEHQVPASHRYISSYWKQGLNEEQHKQVKRVEEAVFAGTE
ncbi:siderophore-interacting protein [Microbulbifer sp. SAOS-129_SWC]|uniref:siderophore-interacting protein n=1 Tax=Microbulbifer sp. SAOS-129_SWC TaxID=3145235 RepID=UPI003216534C